MDKYFKAEQFHNRYIQLYEHIVVVTLIDGTTLEGLYNDDFYEDEAILISLIDSPNVAIVKIEDTWKKDFPEISKRPDILGTLYNQGHDFSTPHANPGSNEFGEFVKDNYKTMEELLGS